jgi:hypothetical protein
VGCQGYSSFLVWGPFFRGQNLQEKNIASLAVSFRNGWDNSITVAELIIQVNFLVKIKFFATFWPFMTIGSISPCLTVILPLSALVHAMKQCWRTVGCFEYQNIIRWMTHKSQIWSNCDFELNN